MDAEKRREERRRAARERVAQRRESGGDAAVERSLLEQRQQQAPVRSLEESVERSPGTTRSRSRRTPTPDTRHSYRISSDAMAELQEQRDEAMAAGARQRAAIQGLVPFDAEEFEQRLGSAELERLERCSFGHCRKKPKWMAPARAEGTPRFTRAFCNEHVTPPE
ncbi:MAG: hypothetical protein AAFZ07_20975 [Actinomycetota bacterium]